MKKRVVKSWKNEAKAFEANLRLEQQHHATTVQRLSDVIGAKDRLVAELRKANDLNEKMQRDLMARPAFRSVDPTAEVILLMRRAMASQLDVNENLLDAVGEIIGRLSGRKEKGNPNNIEILTVTPVEK